MRPRVILHNTVSADGSITGVEPDVELHYHVAASYGAQAHLVGSTTARMGIDMFGGDVPAETPDDRKRPTPQPDDERPLWIIPDSGGALKGLLHVFRRFDHCRDVIVLISKRTSPDYAAYLAEREYIHYAVGGDRVDIGQALDLIGAEHGVTTVLADCGPTLAAVLLQQGLVDELSLIVAPQLVGKRGVSLFKELPRPLTLEPRRLEKLEGGSLRLVYAVVKPKPA
jgi:2,5-diamino-6-(ribosylamino)-4(3H)-pyrimidinone 5'-phosphate reductase